MARSSKAVQDWYAEQLRTYTQQVYAAHLATEHGGDDPATLHPPETELSPAAVRVPRKDCDRLPQEVRAAYDFYWHRYEEADIGSARVYAVPAGSKETYAIRVRTDGDDGYLEVYDRQGAFQAAGRTYLEVVAWGTREWLRAQADHPGALPPELSDANQRTLWGKPVAAAPEAQPATFASKRRRRDGDGGEAPELVEARFTDGSLLKLRLREEGVTVVTKYGTVTVPSADVRKIEFATRTPGASPDDPDFRAADVVETEDSKFAGRIEGDALRATTTQFGDVELKLGDLRSLRMPEALPVLDDPGSLSGFSGQFGTKLAFRVTGADGGVYGTDQYTLDSSLAAAAVHAGVLRMGQTGVVKVEILQSPPSYAGTTRHGVTTSSWDSYPPGAFRFFDRDVD
jgi:hypothetical protein